MGKETKTIKVEDSTVTGAIRKALSMLNAKREEIKVEVLNEEHKGLFGMEGAQRARIKVTVAS